MSSLKIKTFSLEDYDLIASSISDRNSFTLIETLQNSSIGTFDFIKSTLTLLNCLANLKTAKPLPQATLKNLKQIVKDVLEIIIEPLIKDLIMAQTTEIQYKHQLIAQALAKWWLNYLSLLHLAYLRKRTLPGWNESCSTWLPKIEWLVLDRSLQALKGFLSWKMLLLRGICSFDRRGLLQQYISPSNFKQIWEEILSYFSNIAQKELQDAELIHKKTKVLEYRLKILRDLTEILNVDSQNLEESLILKESLQCGRFDKKTYKKFPHSVIVGWDGGFYALMNTITEEEKSLMLGGGDISQDYADRWEKQEDQTHKLIIGKGAFGKIRLCMALTRNESSNKMKPGEIMCVKKSLVLDEESYFYNWSEMNQNVWNDYSSGEVSNLIFSPEVYDLMLLTNASSFSIEAHQKGYSMQKFVAVYDGSKIFQQNGKFFRQWEHQRNYLITLFEVVSSLLSHGVCMTDMKPENTLYDGENGRATLIDLAGVVRKKDKEELRSCQLSELTEYTINYTAPEVLNGNESIDLHKCMAYSLGKVIENIAFTPSLSKAQTKPYHKTLREISEELMVEEETEEEKRISVEEALERIKKLPSSTNSEKIEEILQEFLHFLLEKTISDLKQFGLNPEIQRIEQNFISLMSAPLDPEKVDNQNFTNLQIILDTFMTNDISDENQNNIFVLLGSSGSGKSTILQLNYLKALRNWKENDPIPLFINLAVEDNLKSRWNFLVDQFPFKNLIKFSLFSGIIKRKMILFVDSFDETPVKLNYIEKFFNELGNNHQNKCLICCRSEFVQNYQDFQKWFGSENGALMKQFIAPLQNVKSFKIDDYALQYYKGFEFNISEKEIKDIIQKIEHQNLKSIMKTGYMVHLSLQVLPNLLKDDQKITRRKIYEKYTELKMCRVDESIQNLIKDKFKKFEEFIFESALCLATILHKAGTSKVIYSDEKPLAKSFFYRVHYKSNIKCLANNYLAAVIRCLDLNVETRGNVPDEQITLGFSHDSMKNYFLISSILLECQEGKTLNILSEKLIVEDVFLIKFIVEVVQEMPDFKDQLKKIILKSRKDGEKMSLEEEKKDQGQVIAAANAISILIAANVSFSGCDLSKIRICDANLNDGMFCNANFSEADLTGVVLENKKLDGALFYRTKLENVKLGIYPEISAKSEVNFCCFSPDENKIFGACKDGCIKIWDRKNQNKLLMSLGGQSLGVFSNDGKYIASNGTDNTIKIWDVSSRSLIKTLDGHTSDVYSVVFSPDGKFILSACKDNSIKLWEVSSGLLIKKIDGHKDSVYSVSFSPDGKLILSGSIDNSIKLWEVSSGSLVRTLNGHNDHVNSVAFSQDGMLILSGSRDKSIKLWDALSGSLIKTLDGHKDSVVSVVFSPDGKLILSGSFDKSIKLWEVSSGLLIKTLNAHKDFIFSVAFSSDGKFFLSGSCDQFIKLWEVSSCSLIKTLDGQGDVRSAAFSPDGKLILSGSRDQSIKLWDVSSGLLIKSFDGHSDSVSSLAISPEGKFILSGSWDNSIKLWDVSSGSLIKTLEGHKDYVLSVAISPDGKFFLSGSKDESIKLWDHSLGLLIKTLYGHNDAVYSVKFSPDGKLILSGSGDMSIKLWEVSSGSLIKTLEGHNHSVLTLAFSQDCKFILSGSQDNSIKLWDISSGSFIKTFNGHYYSVNSVAFSPDGKVILSGSSDHSVYLWDISSGSLIKTFIDCHEDSVNSVAFSNDGKLILSGSFDKVIRFWDVSSGSRIKTLEGDNSGVNLLSFSPDGKFILSAHNDNSIKLWEVSSGSLIKKIEGHQHYVYSVSFSPDGKLILSGSFDKSIKLWDVASGSLVRTLDGHNDYVFSVAFSKDGILIVSGSRDNSIKLWDVLSGSLIKTLDGHENAVFSVVFSPDGKLILSGSFDKSIKLWEVSSGLLIKTLNEHKNFIFSVAFSLDGKFFLSGSADRSIKLWDVSGSLLNTFDGHLDAVYSVAFSPDGKLISSGSADKSIKLWDVSSGLILKTLTGHTSQVMSVVFSPDGNLIFSSSNDISMRLWDVSFSSNSLKKKLSGHNEIVRSLAFSPNGKLFLSLSLDKSFKLWDISSGTLLFSFESVNSIPINISNLFKLFSSQSLDDFCIYTLSFCETGLSCKDMIIIDPIEISMKYTHVFQDKKAVVISIPKLSS